MVIMSDKNDKRCEQSCKRKLGVGRPHWLSGIYGMAPFRFPLFSPLRQQSTPMVTMDHRDQEGLYLAQSVEY